MLRLERYGANVLPRAEPPGMVRVFFSQFMSPLIYVLVAGLCCRWSFRNGRTPDSSLACC